MDDSRFTGTDSYVAPRELQTAINAAISLGRPLLLKGEPGTGKSVLARELARAQDRRLIQWTIKSTTKAQHGLYEYDVITRMRDSQMGDPRSGKPENYIRPGKLWEAFEAERVPVLLIDEIDKADVEFPNDLLVELDQMQFYVRETNQTIWAQERPIVIITSNNERELPTAFLRRCFFHYMRFPDLRTMSEIVRVHFPRIEEALLQEALGTFYGLRTQAGLRKQPATSELLDWLKLLSLEGYTGERLRQQVAGEGVPMAGALIKNESDLMLVQDRA